MCMYVEEREMIKKKKVTFSRSLLVEAEEGGWRRSGGIREDQDRPDQTTTKTMATGKAAEEMVLVTNSARASC